MNNEIHLFRDALEVLIGAIPLIIGANNFPLWEKLEGVNSWRELDGETISKLQDFCCKNASPAWATGESIIDVADFIVERAFENGNLKIVEEKGKRFVVFCQG
jgi:hypothetical protein